MKTRRILVSGRFLRIDKPTGTQRSARLLLGATAPHLAEVELAVFAPPGCERLATDGRVSYLPAMAYRRKELDHLWEQVPFPAKGVGSTLLTLIGTGPVLHPGARHVMVVHDINYLLVPESFQRAFRLWYRVAVSMAARRADQIICFTDYVKSTLVGRLGVAAGKIRVIPQGPGISGLVLANSIEGLESPRPYFLCVGSLQPHKNLVTVLLAWREFRRSHPEFRLLVVGRRQERFNAAGIDPAGLADAGVEFTGYVSDADLIELYRGACGFFYPSLEEGFGLPVVEAFYCGCPVVTSNVSCLPEVSGGAALLVNPREPGELCAAMNRLATHRELRDELRLKGLARAPHFNWPSAGKMLAETLLASSG